MAVTLRDVARAAGVSVASASRALAEPARVSAPLRERIGAAAERLGYVPNLAARTLAGKRSGAVGMLAENFADPVAAATLGALDRELRRAGGCLVVAGCASEGDALLRTRELLGRGVDALVAWDLPHDAQDAAACAIAHSVPWLALGGVAGPNQSAAGRARGAALGCRYLQSLGHERFAVLEGRVPGIEGALRALLGARARLHRLPGGPAEPSDLPEALARMLERAAAPTAVLCGSDLRAIAVLRACHAQGVAVPERLSVLGFGDSEAGRYSWPALSTLRLAVDDLAAGLWRTLEARREGREPAPIEPSVKLVVRDSTAHAPR